MTATVAAGSGGDDRTATGYDRAASFLVATGGKHARFGAFTDAFPGPNSAARLRSAFGTPTRIGRTSFGCVMRWRGLGLRAELTNYGQALNPCTDGYFVRAKLTNRRWHTRAGVRRGSRARKARRSAKRFCTPRRPACNGMRGYVLGQHRSDCAGVKVPSVIAAVKHRRVTALFVFTHGCE